MEVRLEEILTDEAAKKLDDLALVREFERMNQKRGKGPPAVTASEQGQIVMANIELLRFELLDRLLNQRKA